MSIASLSGGEIRARLLQRDYDPAWVEWAVRYRDRPEVAATIARALPW